MCVVFKNPQANDLVDWVNQVIHSMHVVKYLSNSFFGYIYPW